MTLSTDEWIKWIDERTEAMLKRPGMWGTNREAIELQLLQLMEVRQLVTDSDAVAKNPRLVINKWIEHSKKHGNLYIATCTEEEFAMFLQSLVDDLKNA